MLEFLIICDELFEIVSNKNKFMEISDLCIDKHKVGEVLLSDGGYGKFWDDYSFAAARVFGMKSKPGNLSGFLSQRFWRDHSIHGDERSMHRRGMVKFAERLNEDEKSLIEDLYSISTECVAIMDVQRPGRGYVSGPRIVDKNYRKENPLIKVEFFKADDRVALKCSGDFEPFFDGLAVRRKSVEEWFDFPAQRLGEDSFVVYDLA